MEDLESHKIRLAVFDWLQQVAEAKQHVLDWNELTKGFAFQGQVIPLIGAKGIWKPKAINRFPISIVSVEKSSYSDEFINNDTLYYSYRGDNPMHPDNVGLREAMKEKIPIVYFHQAVKGKYVVAWPVFIISDEPDKLRFTVSVESGEVLQNENIFSEPNAEYRRKYQTREVLVRLHQKSFREKVLLAYKDHCAVCNLKHRSLLDAAHIIPDSEGGRPEVPNGLSLCKIHHAAYDQHIIGITPDYLIEVREDILHEVDGPMLKHGIQANNNQKLILPRSMALKPNKDWLDERYQLFKKYA